VVGGGDVVEEEPGEGDVGQMIEVEVDVPQGVDSAHRAAARYRGRQPENQAQSRYWPSLDATHPVDNSGLHVKIHLDIRDRCLLSIRRIEGQARRGAMLWQVIVGLLRHG